MRLVLPLVALVACSAPAKPPVTTGSGSSGSAGTAGKATPVKIPKLTTEVDVVVSGKEITMNGVAVSGTPMVSDMEKIFGPPDRTWDQGGANKVHTWDAIGLLVYEPYNGKCISATFPYKPMTGSAYSPKTMFGGSITLDGKKLDSKLPLATIKLWPGATQPYSGASIVFDRDEFHVFTIEEEQPPGRIDLVEISFWQRKTEERPTRRKPVPRVVVTDTASDCRGGDASRCTHLALAYQMGANGRKQPQQAYEMAKLACTGNDAFGCLMLGNMHDKGHGTTQNKGEARTAWKKACTLGYKAACDLK
jgi:hypothetical protein